MKRILNLLMGALVVAIVLSSCKGNVPKEAKYIPKDAGAVVILDPEKMQDKLKKGGISIDTLINRFFVNDEDSGKHKGKFLALRDSAGIDWKSKWFFFVRSSVKGDRSFAQHMTLLGSLDKPATFESFLQKQMKEEGKDLKIVAEKDFKYALLDEEAMVAWNDDVVTISGYIENEKPVFDSTTMSFRKPASGDKSGELKKAATLMFTQKANESLADVKMFTDMFKDKADGYVFSSSNSALPALAMLPFQPPKLEEMMKHNYSTGTLSFEDGKVVMKGVTYPNQLVIDIIKKYPSTAADLSMIENYPSQSVNGFMLFSFNPEMIGGVLKQLEVEGLANNYLSKAGMTSEDLYKALKGQIVWAVSDISIPAPTPDPMDKTNEKNMVAKKPGYKMVFNATVGDKDRFFKLMDMVAAQGFLVKQGNTYKGGAFVSAMGMYVQADDKNLIIASDSLTYAQYVAKAGKGAVKKEVMDKIKNKGGAFYFDIATTLNSITKDSSVMNDHSVLTVRNTFKDVIATFDTFDGSKMKSDMELRLQNEKENSLVTLVSMISDIAADLRAKHRKEKEAERMFPGGVPAIIRTN